MSSWSRLPNPIKDHDMENELPGDLTGHYIGFFLGRRLYGVDADRVCEIRSWAEPSEIADVPSYVCGMIEVNDQSVPVLDLRDRFDIGVPSYDACTSVFIVENSKKSPSLAVFPKVGLVVDRLAQEASSGAFQDGLIGCINSKAGGYVSEEFISDTLFINDRALMIVNLDKLLT